MKDKNCLCKVVLIVVGLLLCSAAYTQDEKSFGSWLEELRNEALERGFSSESIELAFSEIKEPIPRVVSNDRNQAEFVQTYSDYLGRRVSDWKQRTGKVMMAEHREVLEGIEQAYGIQPRFLVAIWGMETNFGTYPITEPLFNVLATLAYDDRRASLFRAQFFAALSMLDSGFPEYEKLTSSLAGAMGQSQFLPENYLRYSVDFDGNGNRDIWDSEADALASVANFFTSFGWSADETWGRKVALPPSLDTGDLASVEDGLVPDARCRPYRSLGIWRDLQDWQSLGVRQEDGTALPGRAIPAALILGDSGDGKGYIVYRNFCTLMRFNPAFKYALSIGLLSDLVAVR